MWKKLIPVMAALSVIFLFVEGVGFYVANGSSGDSSKDIRGRNALQAKNRALRGRLAELAPKGVYVVVDTSGNVLTLRQGKKTLREAVVSCGSGSILEDPSGKREWTFDTPRGVYPVQTKLVKPNWIRPDWAFVEEGEAIPKNFNDRIEQGVLGDYALGFGNGYFIHGTLYTRMLGRNVTHGCVRVGDEDLKAVFSATPLGAKIILF